MQIIKSQIDGCFEIIFNDLKDKRGGFIKTYHQEIFSELGLNFILAEEYFTYSTKNVFRGLHFQIPPMALDKLVFCVSGQVTDYVVDIRKNSPTYGKYMAYNLDGNTPKAIFMGKGLAHGFYVKSDFAMMQYKTSAVYDAKCDAGISYTSFDFAKDIINPIISDRDAAFLTLDKFNNPF